MEVFNFLKNRNWESRYEETTRPASTSNSYFCPDFGSSSYADFQDTVPKYQLRSDRLLRNGFKLTVHKSGWSKYLRCPKAVKVNGHRVRCRPFKILRSLKTLGSS